MSTTSHRDCAEGRGKHTLLGNLVHKRCIFFQRTFDCVYERIAIPDDETLTKTGHLRMPVPATETNLAIGARISFNLEFGGSLRQKFFCSPVRIIFDAAMSASEKAKNELTRNFKSSKDR